MSLQRRHPGTLLPRPDHFLLHIQWTVYRQTAGLAMGSLLSPDIANFYMEDYEKAVL
jgi:hypothetical protein